MLRSPAPSHVGLKQPHELRPCTCLEVIWQPLTPLTPRQQSGCSRLDQDKNLQTGQDASIARTARWQCKLHGSGSRREGWPWHRGSAKEACWRWPWGGEPGLLLPGVQTGWTHAWIKRRPAVLHVHWQPLMGRFWHRTVPGFIWALPGTSCRQCSTQLISQRPSKRVANVMRA